MDLQLTTRVGTVRGTAVGKGPAVLLLHASLHDRRDYEPIVNEMAGALRVVCLDWPSHGESDPVGPGTMDAALLADVLEDVLDRLGESVSLVGNSVGGFAATRAAARRPDQVKRLVIVDGGGFEEHTPFSRAFCAFMGRPGVSRRVMPLFARRYMNAQTAADRAVLARVIERARSAEGAATVSALWRSFPRPTHDLRGEAPGITAPTLVVWGRKDTAVPVSSGRRAHALIPGSIFALLPTGHVPFSSAPRAFLDTVLPFLHSTS